MIAGPWDVVLTVLFACTAAFCVWTVVAHRRSLADGDQQLSDDDIVHIGHAIMSVSMIAMVWWMQSDVLLWAQVALFVVLGVALVPSLTRARTTQARIDTVSHIVLHGAMVWMLAAMPLLMAGPMDAEGGSHHGGDAGGEMLMETPVWASVVNWGMVIASGLVALWWLYRMLTTSASHRIHAACHFAMGVGMTAMLVLMDWTRG